MEEVAPPLDPGLTGLVVALLLASGLTLGAMILLVLLLPPFLLIIAGTLVLPKLPSPCKMVYIICNRSWWNIHIFVVVNNNVIREHTYPH